MENELSVANLPPSVDLVGLRNLFEQYGPVVEVLLIVDPLGNDASRALVTMRNRDAAARVVGELNGALIDDYHVEVSFNREAKPDFSFRHATPVGVMVRVLHISNLPSTTKKEELERLFGRYNPVKVRLRRTRRDAFVHVAVSVEGAEAAIRHLDGYRLDGQAMTVILMAGSYSLKLPKDKTPDS